MRKKKDKPKEESLRQQLDREEREIWKRKNDGKPERTTSSGMRFY